LVLMALYWAALGLSIDSLVVVQQQLQIR